ncbi:MAG TPA: molybdopterin-dependent oxidoreductase [Bryobacteraceae bacterium]|nr:molybdopterin-dependent oxidoreductase [Bryobacteraceae bacterium]
MNRRAFLSGVALAGMRAADAQRELLMPSDQPDEYNFRLMWYNPVPALDLRTYQLRIGGLVDKPQTLAVADLRRLPQETQSSRLKCVQCWSSRTEWGGFRFGHLMELAKPKKTAHAVRLDCADKWYEYYTLDQILAPRVMLVLDMAGKPLAERHGAPLRILDAGRYGYKSAKLITSITFVEEGKGSMACDIGPYYTPGGEIQAGYDHPLDVGQGVRRKISGGEITGY